MWLTWLLINIPARFQAPIIGNLIHLLCLVMSVNPAINIILITKNFPDKALSGGKVTLNVISIILNIITAAGLTIFIIAGIISEPEEDHTSNQDKTAIIILTILTLMTIVNLFMLVCQFGLRRHLKKNNMASIRSMVDSIGTLNS
jgi:nitrate reductase gamma subunit